MAREIIVEARIDYIKPVYRGGQRGARVTLILASIYSPFPSVGTSLSGEGGIFIKALAWTESWRACKRRALVQADYLADMTAGSNVYKVVK